MKKLFAVLVGLFLLSVAFGMEDVEVDCDDSGWWDSPICSDNELDEEFGQITGYISEREAKWGRDEVGGGMSKSGVIYLLLGHTDAMDLYDTFSDWVFEKIAEATEEVHDRIDIIEARQVLFINGEPLTEDSIMLQAALLKSKRTGEHVDADGWDCNGSCIKLFNT